MKSWSNGKIVEGKVSIDSFNYALHYGGPAVWEGIRAYKQENGDTKIWALREHIERLFDSAKIVGLEIPYTIDDMVKACEDVVKANGNGDLYLRPIAYSNIDAESILVKPMEVSVDVYCVPIPPLHSVGKGLKMAISGLVRSYPQYNMQAKTPSNYAVIQPAKTIMKEQSVDDVFVIDNQGYVVEATVANFFVFKGDVAMTPPNRGSILPGITRRTVAGILNDRTLMFTKYKKVPLVIEKDITRADIYTADCVILCGTYAEVVRVDQVDGKKIGTDETQTYYEILSEEYRKLVRGRR